MFNQYLNQDQASDFTSRLNRMGGTNSPQGPNAQRQPWMPPNGQGAAQFQAQGGFRPGGGPTPPGPHGGPGWSNGAPDGPVTGGFNPQFPEAPPPGGGGPMPTPWLHHVPEGGGVGGGGPMPVPTPKTELVGVGGGGTWPVPDPKFLQRPWPPQQQNFGGAAAEQQAPWLNQGRYQAPAPAPSTGGTFAQRNPWTSS